MVEVVFEEGTMCSVENRNYEFRNGKNQVTQSCVGRTWKLRSSMRMILVTGKEFYNNNYWHYCINALYGIAYLQKYKSQECSFETAIILLNIYIRSR